MPTSANPQQPVEVFIWYAQADKMLLDKLKKSLAALKNKRIINITYSGDIEPGKESASEISRLIDNARIILLLFSNEFLANAHWYSDDLVRALERHTRKEAQVIPVILRPCDWRGTEFSRLAALPEGGRPVTKWHLQDDAFMSIVEAVRALTVEGANVGTLKPAKYIKRKIPDLLLYLCNRIEQEAKLSGLLAAENAGPHRPFVCVVHGNEGEGHDMFKSRLKHSSLPKLLRIGAPDQFSVEDILLRFPSNVLNVEQGFYELRRRLAVEVTDQWEASDEEIATALSQYRAPVIIHSYLGADTWGLHHPGVVDKFIEFWSAFPDLPPSTRLIICLFVIYKETGAPFPQAVTAAEQRLGDSSVGAREYFNSLDFSGYAGVRGGVLPEMLAIPLMEAEDYFRDEKYFAGLCSTHHSSFCNVQGAIQDIRSYYRDVGRDQVPMQDLVEELRRVLQQNHCERS